MSGTTNLVPAPSTGRLAFFSAVDIRTGRGTERVIASLMRRARRFGFEPMLLQIQSDVPMRIKSVLLDEATRECTVVNIPAWDHSFGFMGHTLVSQLFYEALLRPVLAYWARLRGRRAVLADVQAWKPDIVYVGFNEYLPFLRALNSKLVLTCHNLPANHPLLVRVLLKLYTLGLYYRGSTAMVAYPHQTRLLTGCVRPTLSLPNGVETAVFVPGETPSGPLRVLYVAFLEREKGVEDVIEIATELDPASFQFTIVGDGPERAGIERLSAQRANITFLSHISDEELARVYGSSDIFLYPTRRDNFPTVVLQALSSGLHTMLSDYLAGAFDQFAGAGYLDYLPTKSTGVWIKRLMELSRSKASVRQARELVHRLAEQEFDWGRISADLYRFLHELSMGQGPEGRTGEGSASTNS